jgi:DNA-binding transcriptional LysR family regulator
MAQLDWYIRANLKPRHLQMLVALDDYRNVGKVAANLNVTQPAVSKALGELERGLGLALFERGARGVNPTVYGECLIRHARAVLHGLAQARDELRDLMLGASGKVSVGALPAAAPALLPSAVGLLKQRSPATTIFIREGTMDVLLPELRAGKLDLIVGTLPHNGAGRDLEESILFEERTTVVAGRTHPLARRKRLEWADLGAYPWVLPPAGSLLREPLEDAFQRNGVPIPGNVVESLSVHVIGMYLQVSNALACLSRDVARHYEESGLIAILPLELPKLVRPVGITWSRARPPSPGATLLMRCLEETVRQRGERQRRINRQAASAA